MLASSSSPPPPPGIDLSMPALVPAWNEEESVAEVLEGLRACAGRLAGKDVDRSVCGIAGGSADGTSEVARRAGADRVLTHGSNRGLGAAVRTGLAHARDHGLDLAVRLDADGQHDPADTPEPVAPILEDRADPVFGDRFPRMTCRMPLVRRWGNASFRSLMRWLLGGWRIRGPQAGMFAANRACPDRFLLPGDCNHIRQVLPDACLKGTRFAQVPVIVFNARTTGSSFVSFKCPFKVFPRILVLPVMARPPKVFPPLAGLFLAAAPGLFGDEPVPWLPGSGPKPVEHVNPVPGPALFGIDTGYSGLPAGLLARHRS